MTRHLFPYPPEQPSGDWLVSLPDGGGWSIGEVIVHASVSSTTPVLDHLDFVYNGTNGVDGSTQTWTVPAGVTWIDIDCYGAGKAGRTGFGGRVTVYGIPVTPGEVLHIDVGGYNANVAGTGAGGWPDGGNQGGGNGYAGAGSSKVTRTPYTHAYTLAQGGGGGGLLPAGSQVSAGGYPDGQDGQGGAGHGTGGTQSAGGTTGGGAWQGGGLSAADVGGGGGGWYGGGYGGGFGKGGGGGSGYVDPAASSFTSEDGVRDGHGLVTIYWPT